MTAKAILSIDQGTTNTKALLVSSDGAVLHAGSKAVEVHYPRPGWAEQSASAIWEAVVELIAELMAAAPQVEVAALAISNQRETIVLWDAESGIPLAPAVIWQCQRSAERCERLRQAGAEPAIVERSGLGLDPLFPAAKIAWLLDSIPGARERAARNEIRCGTIDSWLLWNLTGGAVHATDHSNASRTQLFNLETLDWDPELAAMFDVPLQILPRIASSDSGFGEVATGAVALPAGTKVQAMLGDSHAALFAHSAQRPGCAKATIGTGSSLMVATPARIHSAHGLSSTIAWSTAAGVQHAIEGNISVSGHAASFARTLLGLADEAALTELAGTVERSGGVVFVPALAGLGAPHWQGEARGTLTGMTLGTRPAHVARATLEAIALQIGDVLEAMEADLQDPIDELSIDGGAACNDLLAQMLADLTGRTIVRPALAEASALGVARLAREALHMAEDCEEVRLDRFEPAMPQDERLAIRESWRLAVAGVIASARRRNENPQRPAATSSSGAP